MLNVVLARNVRVAVCTVYNPRFPDPVRRRTAVTGLALVNDIITREAFARRLPVIDLRLVCNEDVDLCKPDRALRAGRRQDSGHHRSPGNGARLRQTPLRGVHSLKARSHIARILLDGMALALTQQR
jgi:hypothetical protein